MAPRKRRQRNPSRGARSPSGTGSSDGTRRGYDGLAPEFDGGPKPRIDGSEWDKVVDEIEGKGMTLRDVQVYVKDTRGVHYAYKTVWKVLRKERYGKAYKMNAPTTPKGS